MSRAPQLSDAAVRSLSRALERDVRGEARFDPGSRALYATDSSNYRQVPVGVVLPRDADDVVAAVETVRAHDAALLPRGGGTSLAGQCCNAAVVLDMSKYMNGLLDLEPEKRRARVQPGIVLDDLRQAAERYHLTFGPDPSTHNRCTLGGMVGNDSCGVHSIVGRRTAENVEALEILTYDGCRMTVSATPRDDLELLAQGPGREGRIYAELRSLRDRHADAIRSRYPHIPRRVSGYNLFQLLPESGFHVARALVGSEGTCVTVLEATVRLIDSPPCRALAVLAYDDVFHAADHVPQVLESGCIGLEGLDSFLLRNMRERGMLPAERALLPQGGGWLVVEFGGDTANDAAAKAHRLARRLNGAGSEPRVKVFGDPGHQAMIWRLREAGLGATAREHGENTTWEGWEDAAVPPDRLGGYLRDFRALLQRYDYHGALYGHFGDGCVHTRINFDLRTRPGIDKWHAFLRDAADLVVSYGGSLSGEHGDGQSKAELLPKMFGSELVEAFGTFKRIWDPDGRMNPGKVVDPYDATQNLRLGPDYDPPAVETRFRFPDDQGSFANATLRCVGVGACRKHDAGTMCPSYMATREERYSTRGRARLLFEMLRGEELHRGWGSRYVKDALDLCLSCKACRHECPVGVDMATYKSEFLFHHYRGGLRPPEHYLLGYLGAWTPLAARVPRLANALIRSPLGALGKRLAGLAPERSLPAFSRERFQRWFARRLVAEGARRGRVLLWPDTYSLSFNPQIARAGVEALEAIGYRVELPPAGLCCGRPFYDFGLLDPAGRYLQRVLEALRPWIRAGVPVVGLEPSCMSVFRDELKNLFPDDEDAKRLAAQSVLFDEFIAVRTAEAGVADSAPRVLVHGHCHQKSLFDFDATARALRSIGATPEVLDAGCCGLSGAFGFRHYDISRRIGERALFPALRAAPRTPLIADGFSCREQIRQFTGRRALHLAEVLAQDLPALQRAAAAARNPDKEERHAFEDSS